MYTEKLTIDFFDQLQEKPKLKCMGFPTVCPPVAELAPRKFGQLFFGRQSGPGWSDF